MDNQILDEQIDTKRVRLKTTAYLFKYWFLMLSCICFISFALFLLYDCYLLQVGFNVYHYPLCIIVISIYGIYIAQTYEVEYQDDTLS